MQFIKSYGIKNLQLVGIIFIILKFYTYHRLFDQASIKNTE